MTRIKYKPDHNAAIAALKLLGRDAHFTINDIRTAYGDPSQPADGLTDTLEKQGLLRWVSRNRYMLTELAWSSDNFTSLFAH
jgi:hypothetical protein